MLELPVLYFCTYMHIFKCQSFSFPILATYGLHMDSTLTNPHAACIEPIPSAINNLPAGYHHSASVHVVPCSTDCLPAGSPHSIFIHVIPCSIALLPTGRFNTVCIVLIPFSITCLPAGYFRLLFLNHIIPVLINSLISIGNIIFYVFIRIR